jgi:hypothetical protein
MKPKEHGCPEDCKCDFYCQLQSDAKAHIKMSDALSAGPWPGPTHSSIDHEMAFQFYGVELVLRPDGTYHLSDTSGG